MRHLFLCFFVIIVITSNAQSKFEIGITNDQIWTMKKELDCGSHTGEKNNWGTSFGIYTSASIWWRFAIESSVKFRLANIQKGNAIWTQHETRPVSYHSGYDFQTINRSYWVIPINLKFNISKHFFIIGGTEHCWITNDYTTIKYKPELNYSFGIGSKKHKLNWNLQYYWGDKQQYLYNINTEEIPGFWIKSKTKRLQLNISYPLWKFK